MSNAEHPPQVRDRAVRLFRFLYEVEKFRAERFHNLAAYSATTPPGAVIWLAGMPTQPEVKSAVAETLDPASDILLELRRTEIPARPELPPQLTGRVSNIDSTDSSDPPALRPPEQDGHRDEDGALPDPAHEHFVRWSGQWRAWVAEVERLRPIRELYRRLFRLYEQIDQNPEDLEVVVAAGCLSWQPDDHAAVQRHLATMQAELTFDAEDGTIRLQAAAARRYSLELDMLDPKRHPRPALVSQAQDALAELDTTLADRDAIGPILKTITHGLSDEAAYDNSDRPGPISRQAHVTFAPALIVRRPSNERKLRVLAAIIDALQEQGNDVPDGVASIVAPIDLDADQPQLDPAVDLDQSESYLPLAANRAQQEIVWSVEHRRHTVVQGPPGTGKTHTIANVLSHLLATGKRVLITAHTERALKEVRGKLPEDLRDLAIAVTGQSRDEKALLERSVRQMTAYVDSYQPAAARSEIADLDHDIDRLRRRQAQIRNDLVSARQTEVEPTAIGAFAGTTAEIAQQLADLADTYSWIDTDAPADPPLSRADATTLLTLLRRSDLEQRAAELDQPLDDLDRLPDADTFAVQVTQAAAAEQAAEGAARHRQRPAHAALVACDDDTRRELATELRAVADDVGVLQRRPEVWVGQLLTDLAAGKPGTWERRAADLDTTLTVAAGLIDKVATASIRVPDGADLERLCAQAQQLAEHLRAGGKVGRLIKAKPVRDAAELLEQVLVDGAATATLKRAETFVNWCLAGRHLDRADALWPATFDIPAEDTFSERLAWHQTELQVLVEALVVGKRLSDLHHNLNRARIPHPDWTRPSDIAELADVADEPDLDAAAATAVRPLDTLAATLTGGPEGPLRRQFANAVRSRDVDAYRAAVTHLDDIVELRQLRTTRNQLVDQMQAALPHVTGRLTDDPREEVWDGRLADLAAACAWSFARQRLRERLAGDRTDELLAELDQTTRLLQQTVLQQTVAGAWSHAVERLDPAQRQRLNRYALLAKRLPQSGKYRARKLREVQDALRLCRDAVPAWIMPINYVADVLDVDPDAFDVVIVDEASQAGMDATFLQYLAPKMIVIGDDLQVSPTSFVDREELHRLADDLLPDFEDKPLWADPETSLFDHANSRFGKRITLVEHFRCMPEIIGFSQRFVYERNGVNLIPLRQYGAERLAPIRTMHVTDGYRTGKVNRPEVDAIVELIAKCDVDPAYEIRDLDGQTRKRTFGVISLTGSDQAKLIEQALIDRLGEQAYTERDLRCGDAADFQGSQREVIFISLVDAPAQDGSRIRKRGDKGTEQRTNVAASRAQDQMWLVHSVTPEHLHPDDIRHQLLAYCISTERQYGSSQLAVPHRVDDRTLDADRFDSLFEQRVFNRIVDRGYAVQPQLNVNGYRIDLVVVGRETKLAVECDGDFWHGPDRYAADIARQRDLERAGWSFFRVRESQFHADRDIALEPLWELLDSHGITPIDLDPLPAAVQPPADPASEDATPSSDDTTALEDAADDAGAPERAGLAVSVTAPASPTSDGGHQHGQAAETSARREPDSATAHLTGSGPLEGRPATTDTHDGPEGEDRTEDVQPQPLETSVTAALDPVAELTAVYATPAPYRSWDTSTPLPHPANSSEGARRDAIIKIIAVEGPILGDRLYHLYIRSRGHTRVSTGVRQSLDRFTRKLEGAGDLVGDDPLDEGGQAARTFRLASQPPFVVRQLGERTLHDIPPLELAARVHALRQPGDDDEGTFRRVLKDYGLSKLTAKTRQRLEACDALAHRHFD